MSIVFEFCMTFGALLVKNSYFDDTVLIMMVIKNLSLQVQ